MEKTLVVACTPAYNEESSIGGVVVRAKRYVDEVIVCDDGSRDLTGRIAGELGAVVVGTAGTWAMYIFGVIQFV